MPSYILTVSCPDKAGIVAAVSGFLAQNQGFILESQQFGDLTTGNFFMRSCFTMPEGNALMMDEWMNRFQSVANNFNMTWHLQDASYRMKVAVLVSREGHCLNAILNKVAMGVLPIEIPFVISNHNNLRKMAESYDVPYHHLPVTSETRPEQERQILAQLDECRVDLIVLARYMQILSPGFVDKYQGRIINIHHSFLPSFKGGQPYQQAFDHGVKLIGATAHYVTAELDEGPIIEQEVMRVNHAASTDQLISIGHDIEAVALTRALRWHIERRIFINGRKTVVFN